MTDEDRRINESNIQDLEPVLIISKIERGLVLRPDCSAIAENPGLGCGRTASRMAPWTCLKGEAEYNAVKPTRTWARAKEYHATGQMP